MTFSDSVLAVFGRAVQERGNWRGKPREGLPTLLQVHGEAAEGRLAQEAAEGSGEELAAALLRAERKHAHVPQRRQGDHSPGETPTSFLPCRDTSHYLAAHTDITRQI